MAGHHRHLEAEYQDAHHRQTRRYHSQRRKNAARSDAAAAVAADGGCCGISGGGANGRLAWAKSMAYAVFPVFALADLILGLVAKHNGWLELESYFDGTLFHCVNLQVRPLLGGGRLRME